MHYKAIFKLKIVVIVVATSVAVISIQQICSIFPLEFWIPEKGSCNCLAIQSIDSTFQNTNILSMAVISLGRKYVVCSRKHQLCQISSFIVQFLRKVFYQSVAKRWYLPDTALRCCLFTMFLLSVNVEAFYWICWFFPRLLLIECATMSIKVVKRYFYIAIWHMSNNESFLHTREQCSYFNILIWLNLW